MTRDASIDDSKSNDSIQLLEKQAPHLASSLDDDLLSRGENDHCFLYFAFGSNMLEERMNNQERNAKFLVSGFLLDFELEFFDDSPVWKGGIASVHQKPGASVWGCVWLMAKRYSDDLDLQEQLYHRLNVNVIVSGSFASGHPSMVNMTTSPSPLTLLCRTYQLSNPNRQYNPPSSHYKQVVVSGAIQHKIPDEYIQILKALRVNGYAGKVPFDFDCLKHLNGSLDIA